MTVAAVPFWESANAAAAACGGGGGGCGIAAAAAAAVAVVVPFWLAEGGGPRRMICWFWCACESG